VVAIPRYWYRRGGAINGSTTSATGGLSATPPVPIEANVDFSNTSGFFKTGTGTVTLNGNTDVAATAVFTGYQSWYQLTAGVE